MAQSLTKEYFDKVIKGQNDLIGKIIHGVRETMATKEDIRGVISHFNKSQSLQNERLDRMDDRFDHVDAKLEAIMEMLTMRQEMHNLIRELRGQGLKLDESKIFVA